MFPSFSAFRQIESVDFYVAGDMDVQTKFPRKINRTAPFQGERPTVGGPCSLTLGTVDYQFQCMTCLGTKKTCPGHNGYIKLRFPLFSPMFFKQIIKVLKKICHGCGHILTIPKAGQKTKQCGRCGYGNPIKIEEGNSPLYLLFTIGSQKVMYYPFMVKEIFDRVTPSAIKALGFDEHTHPSKFIVSYLTVPSVIVRADIKYLAGGRTNSDALTTFIFHIQQKNIALPLVIPEAEKIKNSPLFKEYEFLSLYVYEFIRGTSVTANYRNMLNGKSWSSAKISSNADKSHSLADRIGHKPGRVRGNILGKRTDQMARTVISGEPRLNIYDVKIPLYVATRIFIPEVFRPYNRERLLTYFFNGSKNYPGAKQIKKHQDGQVYDCDIVRDKGYIPEDGDVIYRNIVTGDSALYNRMPSLFHCSVSTHRIVVNVSDPNSLTFKMNVLACKPYNADFDGDEMNLIFGRTLMSRVEMLETSTLKRWFINYKDGKTPINIAGDSIITGFELSKESSRFCKGVMLRYFGNTTVVPDMSRDSPDQIYSGKQIISHILPTDINFDATPSWFKDKLAPYIQYTPDERKTVVINGQLTSGVVDKSFASLFQSIYFKYNATKALTALYNYQQLTLEHALVNGITISIRDIMAPKENIRQLHEYMSGLVRESELISEDYIRGKIVPPIGRTLEQFYEDKQIAALSGDYTDFIYTGIDKRENGLFKLATTGTKGEEVNLENMIATLGQFRYKGQRAPMTFGFRRTSPYFPRCDISAESRGFVGNSFLAGMTVWEFFYTSMQARVDILNKSFLISDAGDQGRISVKNLETMIIDDMNFVIKERNNVTQFLYGGDSFDIRALRSVKYPDLFASDDLFKKKYCYESQDIQLQSELTQFFETVLLPRRDAFRESFLFKNMAILEEEPREAVMVPVDCREILKDIAVRSGQQPAVATDADKREMLELLKKFIEDVPYIYTNERRRQLRSKLPRHWEEGVFAVILNVCMTIDKAVFNHMSPVVLRECLDKIYLQAKLSVIDSGTPVGIIGAQSLSEPMTQAALNSIHAKGQKQKIKKGGIGRIKEILSAKIKEKCNNPMMTIPLKTGTSMERAIEIKNRIEKITIANILVSIDILYESVTKPVNDLFAEDNAFIADFLKVNPPPADLAQAKTFCVRVSFDKKLMLTKDINIQEIKRTFLEGQDYFLVNTSINHRDVFFRFYLRKHLFQSATKSSILVTKDHLEIIKATAIKGIDGIESASVHQLQKFTLQPDSSIQKSAVNVITTVGINFKGIFMLRGIIDDIDYNAVSCDNIDEINKIFGLSATRNKVITELLNFGELSDVDLKHLELIADEMIQSGELGKISRTGANKRIDNALHSIANFGQSKAIEAAAVVGSRAYVESISSSLMVGDTPKIGTDFNQVAVDVDYVVRNSV